MEVNKSQMAERILDLTMEIINLLTGEDCIIMKKTDGTHDKRGSGGWTKTQNRITVHLPHSLILQRNNDEKILALTYKIIHLMTGEKWSYLKDDTDQYRDVMTENHQPTKAQEGSSTRNTSERCSHHLYSRGYKEENSNNPEEHLDKGLLNIKVEDQMCTDEKILTNISSDLDTSCYYIYSLFLTYMSLPCMIDVQDLMLKAKPCMLIWQGREEVCMLQLSPASLSLECLEVN
ncbi:uncharacterized protein LOC130283179 [Hyla sarda]|uniref:uncharacterized protein LOC130283179 n=1 Tax=Hyla sarda TaxID=327740 RepID=UPI0024C4096C|nr:uncharacterized protein LOC130283179 [Hyla sarda]